MILISGGHSRDTYPDIRDTKENTLLGIYEKLNKVQSGETILMDKFQDLCVDVAYKTNVISVCKRSVSQS